MAAHVTEGGGEPERPRPEPAHRKRGDGAAAGSSAPTGPEMTSPLVNAATARRGPRRPGWTLQQPGVWRPPEAAGDGDRRHRREVRDREHSTEPDRPAPVHAKRSERQAGHRVRVAARRARAPAWRAGSLTRSQHRRKAGPAPRTARWAHADQSDRARRPRRAPRARPAAVRVRPAAARMPPRPRRAARRRGARVGRDRALLPLAVLLATGAWLVVKDWRDLHPATRDTAMWRPGLHRPADLPPAPVNRTRAGARGLRDRPVGVVNVASALTPAVPARLRAAPGHRARPRGRPGPCAGPARRACPPRAPPGSSPVAAAGP